MTPKFDLDRILYIHECVKYPYNISIKKECSGLEKIKNINELTINFTLSYSRGWWLFLMKWVKSKDGERDCKYCSFLKMYDWDYDIEVKEDDDTYYSCLLGDDCKECGIREGDDDIWEELPPDNDYYNGDRNGNGNNIT